MTGFVSSDPLNDLTNLFTRPIMIMANRAPTVNDVKPCGTQWCDDSVSPRVIYETSGAGVWNAGNNPYATTSAPGIVTLSSSIITDATSETLVPTVKEIKDYVDAIVVAGAPVSTETTAGIGQLATNAEAVAGTASTGVLALFVTPSNLASVFAANPAIGGTTPAAATVTNLVADGTLDLDTTVAGHILVTGAADFSVGSTAGSINISGGEAAADAINIDAAAGGLDVDVALLLSLTSSRNNANAIELVASAGGIDISAVGTAGEDIDLLATGSSINIIATEDAADSITIVSSNGGIDIITSASSAGEDIDIIATGSSVNLSSTENAALSIYLHADGGTSETIRLRADQGTGVDSIDLLSDVGGITLTSGLASADAINLSASAGGVDIDGALQVNIASSQNAADAIRIVASAGGIDVDAVGASGEDINITNTGGSIVLSATESAADSIKIESTAGGIDILASGAAAGEDIDIIATGSSVNISATESAADSITIVSTAGGIDILASGAAAGEDIDIIATGSSVNISATESAVDSITIVSTAGGIDILASGAAAGEDIDIVATGSSVNISATENNAGAITIGTNGGTSEAITVTCAQGTSDSSIALTSTAGGITFTAGLATADAINIVTSNAGGGIDIDSGTAGFIVDTTGAVSLDSALASNFTVTGAADLTLASSAGAVNITSGEANADSLNMTSGGGFSLVATGAAAKDVIITSTSGSMTLSAGESATDAMNFTAGGAASGINLTAGTNGILLSSGQKVKATSVAAAATPYALLGTDFFVACDVTGGILTITLPASPATGRYVIVSDSVGQSGANTITIDGNTKNISLAGTAAGTKTIATAYKAVGLIYNGTLWNGFALA